MVLLEQRVVDSWLVVEAVDVGLRNEPHEVVVARQVLRMETEMETRLVLDALMVVVVDDIRLAAEDRLDLRQPLEILLGVAAGVVERLQCEEVSVVRDRERRHAPPARPLDKRIDLALPVQKGVGGVEVKMDEIAHVTSPRS